MKISGDSVHQEKTETHVPLKGPTHKISFEATYLKFEGGERRAQSRLELCEEKLGHVTLGRDWKDSLQGSCAESLSHIIHRHNLFWVKHPPLYAISLRGCNHPNLPTLCCPIMWSSHPGEQSAAWAQDAVVWADSADVWEWVVWLLCGHSLTFPALLTNATPMKIH